MSIKGPSSVEKQLDGAGFRIGIVHARWNKPIVDKLVGAAKAQLLRYGVGEDCIIVVDVPGCWELPFTVQSLVFSGSVDAIIAVGVLIKGETMHFEYIAEAVSRGLMEVQLQQQTSPLSTKEGPQRIPVVFGVLTVLNEEQAWARAGGRGDADRDEAKEGGEQGHDEPGDEEAKDSRPHLHNHGEDWARVAIEVATQEKLRMTK